MTSKENYENLTSELKEKHIRLSHQRIMVLDYLNRNHTHPTADQIYLALQKEIPTLSRTTVYNTLNSLAEAKMVHTLTIGSHEKRYDIVTETHGHFKCEKCGMIVDFSVNPDSISLSELQGYQINQKNITIIGICPKCINNKTVN